MLHVYGKEFSPIIMSLFFFIQPFAQKIMVESHGL